MGEKTISRSLDENRKYIEYVLGKSNDIGYHEFVIPALNNRRAFLVYIDGLADKNLINNSILRPLLTLSQCGDGRSLSNGGNLIEKIMEEGIFSVGVKKVKDWTLILDDLLSGTTMLFIDGEDYVINTSTKGWKARDASEPASEAEVRGPRDGFVESIRTNTALIRRRIRDYHMRFEAVKIGERTKTDVILAYIDNLIDMGVLEELKKRLDRIEVDGILESGYIEEFIEDNPNSLLPDIEHTERPDKACAAILEGRIVILVDNTPFVLVVPTVFWQFIQATGDYYQRHPLGTFTRMLRVAALIVSLTASSLYVILTAYHQEMLPTPLALRTAGGREGVPFPSILEALFMEFVFEIMREAGLRMPKAVGQAVSIVGALVIGDAAVNAGLVSPLLVMIVSIGGISSFAIPSYENTYLLRLLRFPLLILSGSLGVLGFLFGTIALILYLLSMRSFGVPFLAPVNPWRSKGNKDILKRAVHWKMNNRPSVGSGESTGRQEETGLKPKPPQNKNENSRVQNSHMGEKSSSEKSQVEEASEKQQSNNRETSKEKSWRKLKRSR